MRGKAGSILPDAVRALPVSGAEVATEDLVERLAESPAYHATFVGFAPVTAREVALAYLRAISTPITGRVLKLHKTNC